MNDVEYETAIERYKELQNINNDDPRCNEFNELLDSLIAYENENNIFVTRVL